jgi:membrane fusion protein (multidrug efflux system)
MRRIREMSLAKENLTQPALKTMRHPILCCSMSLVACLALSACAGTEGESPAPQAAASPSEVHTIHLANGPITRSIVLPAQVIPLQQATLYAKVSGYLKAINVDKGDKVAAGAVLARIEIPELVAARARQEAELKAASSDYERLQKALSQTPDLVVPDTVDQARGRFEVARASLAESETLLGYATITAPFAGVITQRYVDPGALIQAGNASSAIVSLMDFSTVRLQVAVPEIEAARVAVGQPVRVTTDNLPGRQFDGPVTRFTYALDATNRTMLVEAILKNPDLALRPGMLVTVKLGIEHKEQAPLMPTEALVTERANNFAYTVEGDKAVKRPIKVGFNDGKNVEVLDGLKTSDEIILAGKLKLSDGQPVQVAAAQ